jgi:hypothetical protein
LCVVRHSGGSVVGGVQLYCVIWRSKKTLDNGCGGPTALKPMRRNDPSVIY